MEGPAPRVSGARASGVWWVKNTEAPTQGHLTPVAEPAEPKGLKQGLRGKALGSGAQRVGEVQLLESIGWN